MIGGGSSIQVALNISLVCKSRSGIELLRHSAAVPWLSGVSKPHAPSTIAQALSSGRARDRERAALQLTSLSLPSASLIPHLVPKIPP